MILPLKMSSSVSQREKFGATSSVIAVLHWLSTALGLAAFCVNVSLVTFGAFLFLAPAYVSLHLAIQFSVCGGPYPP